MVGPKPRQPECTKIGHVKTGVGYDIPETWIERCYRTLDDVERTTDEHDILLTRHELFIQRTKGTGILEPELASDSG